MKLLRNSLANSHKTQQAKRRLTKGDPSRAFAIYDYYPFWKSRNERSHAGKPFFLDPSDRSTLKVFFDDNIGHALPHIVDIRDVRTGAPIPFKVRTLYRVF